ncbi:MAG TPA: hypothetical protein VIM89_18480 [Mucilaginibacter sp.]
MKDLPYFLALVKKNVILWTIITTGSFAKIDFSNTQHSSTSHSILLKNYSLSNEDRFDDVMISIRPFETIVIFRGADKKYSQNEKYYFGTDEITGSASVVNDSSKYKRTITMLGPIKLNADTSVYIFPDESRITLRYVSNNYLIVKKKRLDSLEKIDSLKK